MSAAVETVATWQDELKPAWPEPEDFGEATPSPLAEVEYIEDIVRPGRITVVAAEEGAGKSFTIDDEACIRLAVAGGMFAETWPIKQCGGVLVLSEMHRDDDLARRDITLQSLKLDRSELTGRYWRLALLTAAGGKPVLDASEWCDWVVGWCREHGVIVLVFDTGTGATQVNPWGHEFQAVYAQMRLMLQSYPALAIVVLVHCKKPQGHAERRITDILGEWGRWCDITLVLERDGLSRIKLTLQKRVSRPRRIVATQRGGLLVDVQDITDGSGPKVPLEKVVAAIATQPGISYAELALRLGIGKNTAKRYAESAIETGQIRREEVGPKHTYRLYPAEATVPPCQTVPALCGAVRNALVPEDRATAPSLYIDGVVVARCVVCDGAVSKDSDSDLCIDCERMADR